METEQDKAAAPLVVSIHFKAIFQMHDTFVSVAMHAKLSDGTILRQAVSRRRKPEWLCPEDFIPTAMPVLLSWLLARATLPPNIE